MACKETFLDVGKKKIFTVFQFINFYVLMDISQ